MSNELTILLMAYNPQYFMESVNSVLNQTFRDYKLIISDNTEHADNIAMFNNKIDDSRVQWIHAWPHTNGDPVAHGLYLKRFVDTKYFKYMFDDDILYPTSLGHLHSILEANESIVCVFHCRHLIDGSGNLMKQNQWLPVDTVQAFAERQIVDLFFTSVVNLFGEVPFSMYKACVLEIFDNDYCGWPLRFLGDIALILKMAELGWVAGSGYILGGYRMHGDQDSATTSKVRLSGIIEYEVICRILNAKHSFTKEQIDLCHARILNYYDGGVQQFPILEKFASNLGDSVRNNRFVPDKELYDLWAEARKLQEL